MRWTGIAAAAALMWTLAGSAHAQIVIELKDDTATQSAPKQPQQGGGLAGTTPTKPGSAAARQHTAVVRRGSVPPTVPSAGKGQQASQAPAKTYGQLGVTIGRENAIYRNPDVRSSVLCRPPTNQYLVIQKPVN